VSEAATRFAFLSRTTDRRDVVDDERVDVFDNVGADNAHGEPTLAAIAGGRHVVYEMPLTLMRPTYCTTPAASEAGIKHMVCFNCRFSQPRGWTWELSVTTEGLPRTIYLMSPRAGDGHDRIGVSVNRARNLDR